MTKLLDTQRRKFFLDAMVAATSFPCLYHSLEAVAGTLPHTDGNVRFLLRDDADYLKHRSVFNKRITVMPKVIALCANESGVQAATTYAQIAALPIAIKSGGHSFEGYSTNEDGMMVDMSGMKGLKYLRANQHVVVQPGVRLGRMARYLHQYGRLVPTGSCAGVGVTGLTLGGGYGFFARELGLTCDSLQRVRMIDGTGKIQDSAYNAELLWACKGGGNGSFGIVTELEFRTHAAPILFNSYRFKYSDLTSERIFELAKRWFELMAGLPNTAYSAWVLYGNDLSILVTDSAPVETPKLIGILGELKSHASTVLAPRKDAFLRGIQNYQGWVSPVYFKNVSAGYYHGFKDVQAMLPEICKKMLKAKVSTVLQINTLGGEIANPIFESLAAYPHRAFGFLGEFQTYYQHEAQGVHAEQLVRGVQGILRAGGIKAHYANYPDVELPDWESAYYGENYGRLQKLKRKLDPQNLIRHPQSVRL